MRHQGIIDKDMGMRGIRAAIEGAAGRNVTKVGLPAEAAPAMPPDAPSSTMVDLVQLAAIHEFGAPKRNIPERSFIRATYDENKTKIEQIQEVEARRIISGESTVQESLSRIGEWLVMKTRKKIENHIPPPLSPATIAAKQGNTPLYDTGQLIQSITHVETKA